MREFRVKRVILTNETGAPVEYALDALLPMSFGPENLEARRE